MINKLRRKMMLLVVAVLVLVSTGIVVSINVANWNQLETQAESVLDILAENNGLRPEAKAEEAGMDTEEADAAETTIEESSVVIDEVANTNLAYADFGQGLQPDAGADPASQQGGQEMKDGQGQLQEADL